VERHDDYFDADTPDPEWVIAIGKRGWIILTADASAIIRWKNSLY
jgi:hypothetical protein